jgi:hypothetical protein
MDDSKWMISVCGLNCGVCDIFQAGKGDKEKLELIIDFFRKGRGINVDSSKIKCEGCRGNLENHWSPSCPMMQCSKLKKVDYCFECTDFICDKLEAFSQDGLSHHKRTVENMKLIKDVGIEEWIKQQTKRGPPVFCP